MLITQSTCNKHHILTLFTAKSQDIGIVQKVSIKCIHNVYFILLFINNRTPPIICTFLPIFMFL